MRIYETSGSASRTWLACYLTAVIGITFIHEPAILAVLLLMALLLCGADRWKLLRRALLAVVAFNLTLSVGYAALSLWQGNFRGDYLVLVNLRVLLLVYLGFWVVKSIDLPAALSGFPLLRLIMTLAISQIKTFERIIGDFQMAFQSRNLVHPRLLDKSRHAASQAQTLLDKSMASAGEAALAMRSRGTFGS